MKIKFALIAAMIVTLILCSCSQPEEYSMDIFAMDTYMSLMAYGRNSEKALEEAAEEIEKTEELLSVTRPDSEISQLNENGFLENPSDDMLYLVKTGVELNGEVDGAFDITLYPVIQAWGFTTESKNIPTEETLVGLLSDTGVERVHFENGITLDDNTKVDLGGIAKGYAGKKAADILKQYGITSALLNMGGNIQTIGAKPDGSSWKIGIKDPQNESSLVGSVEIIDKAVVTSGGYERFFIGDDGKRYHHIIDPKTGKPAENGIISATVIGDDGTLCDALSTSLYIMGTEKASEYLNAHSETNAILVTEDRTLYITRGIEPVFKPLNEYINTTINVIG